MARWLAIRVLWVAAPLVIGALAAAAGLVSLGAEILQERRWAMLWEAVGLRRPVVEAPFDVFESGGVLTYVREPCDATDVKAGFFLHVWPWKADDLPPYRYYGRNEFGFDNRDFDFAEFGALSDGVCTLTVPLPKYPIRHVATGQFDDTGQLWAGSFNMPRPKTIERNNAVFAPGEIVPLSTRLHTLEVSTIQLQPFAVSAGGAVERVGQNLLVVTPGGRFAIIGPNGRVSYLEGRVPTGGTGSLVEVPDPAPSTHRVVEILVRKRTDGHYDLFATHQLFTRGGCMFRLSTSTLRVVHAGLEISPSWRTVFAKPCSGTPGSQRPGGRLLTDGPRHLLLTESVSRPAVLRVDLVTGAAVRLTTGHRNPQGLTRDRNGNLWLTEHGPQGGDELNLLKPGGDYGWPAVSYGYRYGRWTLTQDDSRPGHHDGFIAPTFAWVSSIGISAVVANDPTAFPLWADDLLIGSLATPEHGNSLFRVRHWEEQVRDVERIELGERIRDLAHAPDGALAVLTDTARVLLLRRSDV